MTNTQKKLVKGAIMPSAAMASAPRKELTIKPLMMVPRLGSSTFSAVTGSSYRYILRSISSL